MLTFFIYAMCTYVNYVPYVVNTHILSGTLIPNKPIADAIVLADISQICSLNCFFNGLSAFITECSV
jgi:hypothetical protein